MSTRSIDELFGEVRQDEAAHADSRLLYVIHEVSRLISTRFDRAMARHRFTHAQWWAMMHIAENEGITQTAFADLMQTTRAPAGKLLERLEAKGWIERRPDPSDNRVRRIFIAEGAYPFFEAMQAEGLILFRDLLGNLTRGEVAQTLDTLRAIKRNLGN